MQLLLKFEGRWQSFEFSQNWQRWESFPTNQKSQFSNCERTKLAEKSLSKHNPKMNSFIHSIFNFYSNLALTFHSFRRSSFPMLFNSADCPYWNRFLIMAKIRQNFYLFFWKFPFDVLKFKFHKRSVLQIHFGNAKLDSNRKFICKLK